MLPTSKIYIAGHTGLVGSAITRLLTKKGFSNLILRTRTELDLTIPSQVKTFFNEYNPEYIFLVAAKVGGIKANIDHQADFWYENSMIQNNIIKASADHNIKKLLFLGSSCIYPKNSPQPIKEEYLLTGPLEPTNEAYALAKISGIKYCEHIFRSQQKQFISLMPTNIYGSGDNYDLDSSHVLPALIHKFHLAKINNDPEVVVWGTGQCRREFLFSDDLASACLWAIKNYDQPEFLNVGTGQDLSIKELAELIQDIVEYPGKIVFDNTKPEGMKQKLLDISRINKLGWKAQTNLREGLIKTYKEFLNNKN